MTTLTAKSAEFPRSLRDISDKPDTLYARGDLGLLEHEPKIAIIGSRHPSAYGLKMTQQLAHGLASAGICIVSGLALGVDGAAHQACLDAGGKTIAVLGTAIDRLYPKSNQRLAESILAEGLVLSEYAPQSPMKNWQFAYRNRLISGLAQAIVVVEAAEKSGTLITVQYGLEQGKEIFAIPGPADAALSGGTLKLIRDGARCVRSAEDVLEDLNLQVSQGRQPVQAMLSDSIQKHPLLQHFEANPMHIDSLIDESGLSAGELSQNLLSLELSGFVKKLPGQFYRRLA